MEKLRMILLIVLLWSVSASTHGRTVTMRYDMRDGLSSQLVGGGVQDSNGLLWFATWNGLNCYDGYDFHWVKIQPGDKSSIGTNLIRDIHLLPDGNILCHTDNDIYEFDIVSYTFRDIPAERKDTLMMRVGRRWHGLHDSQGGTWISDHKGLYKTFTLSHPAGMLAGTSGSRPRAMLVDRDGNLWVGMRGRDSVAVYNRDLKLVRTFAVPSPPYCIYQTGSDEIWIGCKPGALLKPDGQSITDEAVYDVCEDRYGRLWIATFGGGVRCCANPDDTVPVLSPSLGGVKVRKLLITPSDNIIASTSDGLFIGHVNSPGEPLPQLRAVRRDGDDHYSLSSNSTLSIARDSRGNIYVCTESSGVDMITEESLFSSHPRFTHFNSQTSSLGVDDWKAMTLDSDSLLWLVGNDRLIAYNPLNDKTITLGESFWADSCNFAEISPVRLPDGKLALGAEEGVFIVSDDEIFSQEYIPPLVFTTMSVNGGVGKFMLAPLSSITLPAESRNLTIGFAALDYIDNKSILYRVSVDGSPWTDASSTRSVTLFNMLPGSHILEIQSTDRYGRWVDNRKSLEIMIRPYWYETWWARLIFCFLMLIALSGVVYTYLYVRRVNRQRSELFEKYMQLLHEKDIRDEETTIDVLSEEPRQAADKPIADTSPADASFLNRVTRYIENNLDNPEANIDDMAEAAAVSRSTLNRRLRSLLGVSASQFMTEARMRNALVLLGEHDDISCPVSEVAVKCGYSDVYYFQRVFRKKYGKSPAEYRREN